MSRTFGAIYVVAALGCWLPLRPVGAQEFTMGLAFGAVKPATLDATLGGTLAFRFPVANRVDLQLDLSAWKVTEPQVAQFYVGSDSQGNDLFTERVLDYPVSDLSLSLTPLFRVPLSSGFQLVPGAGVGLHFVTSDLRRIKTGGDSDLRLGAHASVALERFVTRAVGVSFGARYDLVANVNQLKAGLGILIRPQSERPPPARWR